MNCFLLHIWKERKGARRRNKACRAFKDGSDKREDEEGATDQVRPRCTSSIWDDAAPLVFSDTIPSSARVAPDTWFSSQGGKVALSHHLVSYLPCDIIPECLIFPAPDIPHMCLKCVQTDAPTKRSHHEHSLIYL